MHAVGKALLVIAFAVAGLSSISGLMGFVSGFQEGGPLWSGILRSSTIPLLLGSLALALAALHAVSLKASHFKPQLSWLGFLGALLVVPVGLWLWADSAL